MKKLIFLALACLAGAVQSFAMDSCCSDSCSDCFGFDAVLTFNIGGGYRQDALKWTTYPTSAPGTVVHEKWKNLTMPIVEANAQFLACEHYLLRADFDYGWFCDNGKQSIRTLNAETGTLTGDLHAPTKGRTCDLTGALGYQFNWCCYRYSLAPLVGYGYSHQKFVNKKYHDELVPINPTIYTHNTYRYRWSGPLVGVAAAYQITCNWQVAFEYAYHWLSYRAKITEYFDPITTGLPAGPLTGTQKSRWGSGNEFTLSTAYEFAPDWLLSLKGNYKYYTAANGKFSNDTYVSQVKKISWTSWNVAVDLGYIF